MVIMVSTCFLNEHELFPRGFTQYTPVVSGTCEHYPLCTLLDVILYHSTSTDLGLPEDRKPKKGNIVETH